MQLFLPAMLIAPEGQAVVGNGLQDRTFNLWLLVLLVVLVVSMFRGRKSGGGSSGGGGSDRRDHDRRGTYHPARAH